MSTIRDYLQAKSPDSLLRVAADPQVPVYDWPVTITDDGWRYTRVNSLDTYIDHRLYRRLDDCGLSSECVRVDKWDETARPDDDYTLSLRSLYDAVIEAVLGGRLHCTSHLAAFEALMESDPVEVRIEVRVGARSVDLTDAQAAEAIPLALAFGDEWLRGEGA